MLLTNRRTMKFLISSLLLMAVSSQAANITKQEPVQLPSGSRTIDYKPNSIPKINTRLRLTTALVFPDGERIAATLCGDKENWSIEDIANVVYIKPKPSRETTLTDVHIMGKSGNHYSFAIEDVGNTV